MNGILHQLGPAKYCIHEGSGMQMWGSGGFGFRVYGLGLRKEKMTYSETIVAPTATN